MSNVKSMHEALEPRLSPIFVVLVGLPGTGKTTLRDEFFPDYAHLSCDDYIEAKALEEGKTYNEVWRDYINEAEKVANERFHAWHQSRANIVWDRTNLTVKSRRGRTSPVSSDYWKVAVYLELDEDERQERLANRPEKIIPPEADENLRKIYVRPTLEEGFDRVIDGNDLQWGLIY